MGVLGWNFPWGFVWGFGVLINHYDNLCIDLDRTLGIHYDVIAHRLSVLAL